MTTGKNRAVDLSRVLGGAADALSRTRTCWLVTRSEEGIPRCRPMSLLPFEAVTGWTLRLVTDARSRKVEEIWGEQRVCVLCHARGGSFVSVTGRTHLVFEPEEVNARWREAYDPFFPGEARAQAAFIEVDTERLDLWIAGATPEPFGMGTTTLERDASGRWVVLPES